MAKIKDLMGRRFERLVVIGMTEIINGQRRWNCKCDCGTEVVVTGGHLRAGNTKSCGCLKVERAVKQKITHGKTGSRTYTKWSGMLDRCNNKNNNRYHRYGGRGISVCKRWHKFENFLADMGEAPEGKSIDRIKTDGNYEPGNCRWATTIEQQNNRSTNRLITFEGKTQSLIQWGREYGISWCALRYRIENGWDMKSALTKPNRLCGDKTQLRRKERAEAMTKKEVAGACN